jgi:taurine dioxygenase
VVWDNQAVQHGRPYLQGDGPARTLRKIHAPGDLAARIGALPTYERKS